MHKSVFVPLESILYSFQGMYPIKIKALPFCLTGLFALIFHSCGVPSAEHQQLQSAYKQLEKDYAALQAEQKEWKFVSEYSQVVISNTAIHTLPSNAVDQDFQIKVSFPRSYHKSEKQYPVLYVIDAETNFGGVSYVVQRLIKDKLIPEILVVGIAYGTSYEQFYRLRCRDLTQVADPTFRPGGASIPYPSGGAAAFSQFLEEELFPFIRHNYRVQEGERAIYGHSLGGLYGAYAVLAQAGLFNKYLSLSPSLWWKNDDLMSAVANDSLPIYTSATRLYMASGELEWRIDSLQQIFAETLAGRQADGLAIRSEVFDNETHRTIFGRGFMDGLRWLYGE